MGNSSYDCSVRTSSNMLFDTDLEITVVKACQSGDYRVWQAGGYDRLTDFNAANSDFTMWNAFHGNSSCGSHVKRYVKSYAKNSTYNGVGENWIDAAYRKWIGRNNDDCPVSIVGGSSASKRSKMFEYGGWRDRKDTGSKLDSDYFYVSGCNPSSGVKLP